MNRRSATLLGALGVCVLALCAVFLAEDTPAPRDASADAPSNPAFLRPAVDFLGDSYTGGSGMGGGAEYNYTALLASRFDWRVENRAIGGTGYVNGLPETPAFGGPRQVERVAADLPSMVVVVGGVNDEGSPPEAVRAAATTLYDDLRRAVPGVRIVVVGVIWPRTTAPPDIVEMQATLRGAAADAGVPFIDPIADGWFAGERERLIGVDGVHPTDEGHAHMARVLGDRLEQLGMPRSLG